MNKDKIKKILIIRYRFIGDTVLLTSFIRNVKENFPHAKIDVLVSPNSGEIIEGNPHVNKIIYLDSSTFHKYEKSINNIPTSQTYYSLFGCAVGLKKEKYDLSFVLKRSFSSALLAFFSGAEYRVGFDTEFRSFLLTDIVKYNKNIHELENFNQCLKAIGIKPKNYIPEIFPSEYEEIKADKFIAPLNKQKPKILIHMTSAHPYKQWNIKHIGKLLDLLFLKYEAQFIFTGAQNDKNFYNAVLKKSKHGGKFKILNLCGLTTIRECYSLYKKLDLAICSDSGNAHIAAAAGIPTYVIFGPTQPEKWLPIGKKVFSIRLKQLLSCQPCDVKVFCSHKSCMKLLTPDFVFSNVEKSLN